MSLQSINQNELKLKSNQKEEIKEQKPPPPKPVPKQSSFWGGGSNLLSKANEPLSEYYENRKKLIFGKINILEDENFISQFLLNSQNKINKEYKKMTSGFSSFFDTSDKLFLFCQYVKETISNFCLIIHLYLLLNQDDKAYEIFLLLCKENNKIIEYIYKKLKNYCIKSGSAMLRVAPKIAKILIMILSCLIKYSVKFSKISLQNHFVTIYLKTILSLNYREIKTGNAIEYKNEIKYNRLYIYANCLFDAAIFHFYNYYPLNICTDFLQHIIELYNDNFREKNNYELQLMLKSSFNSGFFYYVDNKFKEAVTNLQISKEFITEIIQNNLNSKDDEKEFLNDLNGYSYLDEEKNSLFCLKINDKRISRLHGKGLNLDKFLKENNLNPKEKKASSVVLGSKKYELKLPLLLEQIKRKIILEIDLLLCQIEMNKKNYKAAYDLINIILKSNTIKDDYETKNIPRKKKFGVNKSFKSLKTYQNIHVKPKLIDDDDNLQKSNLNEKDYALIFFLLDKIEYELGQNLTEDQSYNIKKKSNLINIKPIIMNYTNFKELEKFFIFICSLSLFQLKILNESQPSDSSKRDDLPIIFATTFRDCLTNNQRMYLDELQTMSLSRYIILVDSKKEISPENLDYKYMKYQIKTQINNDEEKNEEEEYEFRLSFDEEDNININNKIRLQKGKGRNKKRTEDNYLDNNKGLFTASTNVNNSSSLFKRSTNNIRKKTKKRSLSFQDDSEDENKLNSMLKNIKNEKIEKFMNKNRKIIKEYLDCLNKKEKTFLLDNQNLLTKMMENVADNNNIVNNKVIYNNNINKNNIKKTNDNISLSFSYEISQKSQNSSNK